MQKKSKPQNILLLLAVAGFLSGLAVCFLGQHLNGKIYEYGAASSSRFQEAFGQISFSLLLTGGLIGVGSLLMLILISQLGSSPKANTSDDLAKVLRDCGIENVDSDPLQTLQRTLSQLKLDLVEGKKRERSIIEKAVDVICVLDIHSRFLTVSKASQHAWGYNPQELEKTSLKDILVGDNSNNVLDSILGSANSIDKIIFECKLRRKDGRLIDVVWTAHWSASDGGLFCIVHDISERKYAERLLKNSENRLRRTLKGMPVGVLLLDNQGIVEFANAEAARMLHYASREIVSESVGKFISTADKEERIQNDQQDASSEQQLKRFISNCIRKDASSFPVDLSEGIIELGEEQKTIVVFIDKTAEKELERVKREFMAMVTHEIRTPISSVYGILALLEVGALGEMTDRGKDLTRGVKATCKRVIGLITDLLDLEKMQAGKFALDCKQVSVRYAMEAS
ncbi:MAG: PAS domain S-box protein, partial [Candidatus Obscuribacterales bacterium]|nr:PAS domain S-box protein [Candidatus Obscuribacterales bacterium]